MFNDGATQAPYWLLLKNKGKFDAIWGSEVSVPRRDNELPLPSQSQAGQNSFCAALHTQQLLTEPHSQRQLPSLRNDVKQEKQTSQTPPSSSNLPCVKLSVFTSQDTDLPFKQLPCFALRPAPQGPATSCPGTLKQMTSNMLTFPGLGNLPGMILNLKQHQN